MGQIRKYSCQCGYEKQAFTGAGMHGCNLRMIQRFFPEEADMLIREKERVKMYMLQNVLAECETCQKLFDVPQLLYQKEGEAQKACIMDVCPECEKPMTVREDIENVKCPLCGKKMIYEIAGDWD